MKKSIWEGPLPLMIILSILIMIPSYVLAGVDPAPWEAPIFLKPIIDMIMGLPIIGPILYEVLKWTGIIAVALTGIAGAIMGVAKVAKESAKLAGFVALAEKIDGWYQKIFPIVAWLSMLNVQKPAPKK